MIWRVVILLLFLVLWGTAKLTIGFQPWPKFTSSVAKKVSFPLSTIFRSELEEMPLPFLLGQGFVSIIWLNSCFDLVILPSPSPKNLKSSTWSNKKSRFTKNQTIKPVKITHQKHDDLSAEKPPHVSSHLVNRPWSPSSCRQVNKHGTDVEVLMAKSRLFRGPISSTKLQAKTQRRWGCGVFGEGVGWLHPWKLTWNPKMEVWKMIFLFKQVIFRCHVNFPGCNIFKMGCLQVHFFGIVTLKIGRWFSHFDSYKSGWNYHLAKCFGFFVGWADANVKALKDLWTWEEVRHMPGWD